jgi:hypothetical protein
MPIATDPLALAHEATAAGAEDRVGLVQPAVEVQTTTASAAGAEFCAAAGDPVAVEAQASPFAMCTAGAAFSAASPKPRAEKAKSFRASSENSGAIL